MREREIDNCELRIEAGDPEKLGVCFTKNGINFAFAVPGNLSAELFLYQGGDVQPTYVIPLPEEERVGCVSAVFVRGLSFGGGFWEYSYRVAGRELADPYGRLAGLQEEGPRCLLIQPTKAGSSPLDLPYEDCIFYKLHVRGFTRHRASKVRHKGTFRGVQEKIPYLKELGITSLILMPVYEFRKGPGMEENLPMQEAALPSSFAEKGQPGKENYWGYTGGLYFAPRRSYSRGKYPDREFAEMIDALHEAGLECILEFYFAQEEPVQKVLDVLHYWRLQYQVDGFHLVGRGSWEKPVAEDPLLSCSKLLFTACPVDMDTLKWRKARGWREATTGPKDREGTDPDCQGRYLAEINRGYEETMRRFLKGDGDCLPAAIWYLRKNSEALASINYFADQDGYTMADMVAYERKHNEENGEGGRDGSSDNYSWNCGVEGPTRRMSVRRLRMQQLYNAFLILMTSQGSPMIYGGDECLNSQGGNNNAWCQDNETGWLTWSTGKDSQRLVEVVRKAIAFRRAHPMLHRCKPLRMTDYQSCGCPDLSYHGAHAWVMPREDHSIGLLYCGSYAEDDSIYIAYNMYWEPRSFAIPRLKGRIQWYIKADTGYDQVFYPEGEEPLAELTEDKQVLVGARRVMILTGRPEEQGTIRVTTGVGALTPNQCLESNPKEA